MFGKFDISVFVTCFLILKEDLIFYGVMVFFKGIFYVKFRGIMFFYVINL